MKLSTWAKVATALGVVAAVTLGILFLPVKEGLSGFLEWIRGLGFWGPIVLAVAYIPAAVLLVPGSVMTMGAGFAFGVPVGVASVSAGSTLGACVAFVLGRTLLRGWVEERASRKPKFGAVDQAVGKEGLKIVFLLRLSPVFPYTLLNYFLGVTKVPLWKFVLASWVGMLPGTVMYVYLGSAVRSLAEIASGKVEGGMGQKILFGVGLLATVAVTVLVTRIARKAIREAVPEREADRRPSEGRKEIVSGKRGGQ